MSVLPVFPEFTPLQLSHAELVAQFTKQFPPYADYTFTSLYSWDTKEVVALSSLSGNLVVRFSDETSDDVYLSFLGKHELEKTIDTLLHYAHTQGYNPNLCLIAQSVIRTMPWALRTKYFILEDRNNHDYILSVDDLCSFEATHHRQRKARYNQFMQAYGEHTQNGLIDLQSPQVRAEMEGLFLRWQQSRHKQSSETQNEFSAIRRCISASQQLGVRAYGTYVDGRLVACNLFEVENRMAIGHFMKADSSYQGVFEHFDYMFARYLQTQGITYLNIQQDMGFKGLRAHKLAYGPAFFLKKYTIATA